MLTDYLLAMELALSPMELDAANVVGACMMGHVHNSSRWVSTIMRLRWVSSLRMELRGVASLQRGSFPRCRNAASKVMFV
jgi:hypothetical protein